ncbi:MAG: VanZ family protein, partial [Stomatobaculum longum]|nr:VanZ family protein [Stomatobaculum longum]
IETAQLLTRLGSFDVDDIFLNTIGVVMGYFIFRLFLWRLNRASA